MTGPATVAFALVQARAARHRRAGADRPVQVEDLLPHLP